MNFSLVNIHYLKESQSLIRRDRNAAKIVLGLPDDLLDFVENLTAEDYLKIAMLKVPLPKITSRTIQEFMKMAKKKDESTMGTINDRILLEHA